MTNGVVIMQGEGFARVGNGDSGGHRRPHVLAGHLPCGSGEVGHHVRLAQPCRARLPQHGDRVQSALHGTPPCSLPAACSSESWLRAAHAQSCMHGWCPMWPRVHARHLQRTLRSGTVAGVLMAACSGWPAETVCGGGHPPLLQGLHALPAARVPCQRHHAAHGGLRQ